MRILSRYILREFLSFLLYSLLAFIAVFILVDVVDNVDGFIDKNIAANLIVLYYALYLPFIVVLVTPVAMLLTAMFSLGRLLGDNEITAMKTSGISLYRILMPLYGLALVVSLAIMLLTEFVVPQANMMREDIDRQGNAYRFTLSNTREMDRSNVFLATGNGGIVYARNYDSQRRIASRVFYIEPFEYDAESVQGTEALFFGIRRRIDAETMQYSDGVWQMLNARERWFNESGETLVTYPQLSAKFIMVQPQDFARIDLAPEEMNYIQLRSYIKGINARGGDAAEWLVDLYMKIAFPFVSFVIVFFGAPMVSGSSKRGKAASFGLALIICFGYYSIINICQVLGRDGTLNPVFAAWFPNSVFLTFGGLLHLRARR